jgi:hypothetical protein
MCRQNADAECIRTALSLAKSRWASLALHGAGHHDCQSALHLGQQRFCFCCSPVHMGTMLLSCVYGHNWHCTVHKTCASPNRLSAARRTTVAKSISEAFSSHSCSSAPSAVSSMDLIHELYSVPRRVPIVSAFLCGVFKTSCFSKPSNQSIYYGADIYCARRVSLVCFK